MQQRVRGSRARLTHECGPPPAHTAPPRPPAQATTVLGATADDMAALRSGGEEGDARFRATLKAARWQTWVMNVQVRGAGDGVGESSEQAGAQGAELRPDCSPREGVCSARLCQRSLVSGPRPNLPRRPPCRLQARSREYQGERRMRYTVMQVGGLRPGGEGRPGRPRQHQCGRPAAPALFASVPLPINPSQHLDLTSPPNPPSSTPPPNPPGLPPGLRRRERAAAGADPGHGQRLSARARRGPRGAPAGPRRMPQRRPGAPRRPPCIDPRGLVFL
jgi:hypothetical protein